jgi:hypothetical protein
MKNTKIHQGLEKSELRDFFSISLLRNLEKLINNEREQVFKDNEFIKNGLDVQITYAVNEIKYQKKNIEILNEKKSLLLLMENMDWSEFDVSDETERDFDSPYWLSFIGTEEEFDFFLNLIKK